MKNSYFTHYILLNINKNHIHTSSANCLNESSYSPLAAYNNPKFLYNFDLMALEHDGVFKTVHWAWAKYSSACDKRPKPETHINTCNI